MADSEKPKIIVDEDWKSKVQAEKEAAKQQQPASEQPTPPPEPPTQPPKQGKAAQAQPQALPEASFSLLVSSLATQALACLGQLPAEEGEAAVQPQVARHYIDLLSMLEEKTRGNLSSEEAQMLSHALRDLRLLFVQVSK